MHGVLTQLRGWICIHCFNNDKKISKKFQINSTFFMFNAMLLQDIVEAVTVPNKAIARNSRNCYYTNPNRSELNVPNVLI